MKTEITPPISDELLEKAEVIRANMLKELEAEIQSIEGTIARLTEDLKAKSQVFGKLSVGPTHKIIDIVLSKHQHYHS